MDDWEFNSQQDQVIFLFSKVLTHLLSSGYQGSFPGVKCLEQEVNHSPVSSSVVKNEYNHNCDPCMPSCRAQGQFFFYLLPPPLIWGPCLCL